MADANDWVDVDDWQDVNDWEDVVESPQGNVTPEGIIEPTPERMAAIGGPDPVVPKAVPGARYDHVEEISPGEDIRGSIMAVNGGREPTPEELDAAAQQAAVNSGNLPQHWNVADKTKPAPQPAPPQSVQGPGLGERAFDFLVKKPAEALVGAGMQQYQNYKGVTDFADENILKPLQENVGRPAIEAMVVAGEAGRQDSKFDPSKTYGENAQAIMKQNPDGAAAAVGHAFLSTMAGPEYGPLMMTPEQTANAKARLPRWNVPLLGEISPVEMGAQIMGNPSTYIDPAIKAPGIALKGFPILSKVLNFTVREGVEGGITGGADAVLDRSMSIPEGVAGGALTQPVASGALFKGAPAAVKGGNELLKQAGVNLGQAGFGARLAGQQAGAGAQKAAQAVQKAAKKVAFVAKEQIPALARELNDLFEQRQMKMQPVTEGVDDAVFAATEQKPLRVKDIKPSIATTGVVDGKPAVIFHEFADGDVRQAAMVLDGDKAVNRAVQVIRQHNLPPVVTVHNTPGGQLFSDQLDARQMRALMDRNSVNRSPGKWADVPDEDLIRSKIAKGELEWDVKPNEVHVTPGGDQIPTSLRAEAKDKKGRLFYAEKTSDDLGQAKVNKIKKEAGIGSRGPDERTAKARPEPVNEKPPPPPEPDPDLPIEMEPDDFVLTTDGKGHVKAEPVPRQHNNGVNFPKEGDVVTLPGGKVGIFRGVGENRRAVVEINGLPRTFDEVDLTVAPDRVRAQYLQRDIERQTLKRQQQEEEQFWNKKLPERNPDPLADKDQIDWGIAYEGGLQNVDFENLTEIHTYGGHEPQVLEWAKKNGYAAQNSDGSWKLTSRGWDAVENFEYSNSDTPTYSAGGGAPSERVAPQAIDQTGVKSTPVPREYQEMVLRQAEDKIRHQNYETAVFVHGDGRVNMLSDGPASGEPGTKDYRENGKNSVKIPDEDALAMAKDGNAGGTHNHPSGNPVHSGADVHLAVKANMAYFQATAPERETWHIQRPANGWWDHPPAATLDDLQSFIYSDLRTQLDNLVLYVKEDFKLKSERGLYKYTNEEFAKFYATEFPKEVRRFSRENYGREWIIERLHETGYEVDGLGRPVHAAGRHLDRAVGGGTQGVSASASRAIPGQEAVQKVGSGTGEPPGIPPKPPPPPEPTDTPWSGNVAHGPYASPRPEFDFTDQSPLSPAAVEDLKQAAQAANLLVRSGWNAKRLWNDFKDLWVSPAGHGPLKKQDMARQLMGSRAKYVPDEYFKAFEKRIKNAGGDVSPNSKFAKDLAEMHEGVMNVVYDGAGKPVGETRIHRINDAYMRQHHPVEWGALEDMARPVMEKMQRNSEELAAELGDAGKHYLEEVERMRAAGLFELFVGRQYRAYSLKGQWHRLIPTEALEAGTDYIYRQLQEWIRKHPNDALSKHLTAKKGNLKDYIANEVMDLVKKDDPLGRFLDVGSPDGKGGGIGKPFQHLRARMDDLPGPIKNLLGFETSGLIRFAHTLASQEYLLSNIKIWNHKIAADPTIFSPIKTPEFSVPVPDQPHKYGRAAGGYVTEDYRFAVQQAANPGWLTEMARTFTGPYKSMQIRYGGPATWMNNFFGNPYFSMMAGGLDPLRPAESGRAWGMAWHMLVSDMQDSLKFLPSGGQFPKEPFDRAGREFAPAELVGSSKKLPFFSGDIKNWKAGKEAAKKIYGDVNAQASIVNEARKMGVDSPGLAGVDAGGKNSSRVVRALAKEMSKLGPDATINQRLRAVRVTLESFKDATSDELAHAYDLIDRVYKMANYISLRQRYMRQFNGNVEMAAAKAAQRIHDSFPDYRQMGKIPEAIASTPPVANAFVRWTLENMRIHGSLPRSIARDPQLLVRAGFYTAALSSFMSFMSLMSEMGGVSREEQDALKANMGRKQRAYKPLVIPTPFRKENGEPMMIDITQQNPWAMFLTGHPDDALWQNILGSTAMNMAGPLTEDTVESALHNMGVSRKFGDYQTAEGDRGAVEWGKKAIGHYALPGAVTRQWNYLEQAGLVGRDPRMRDEEMSMSDLILRSTGATPAISSTPATSGYSPSYNRANAEDVGTIKEATRQMYSRPAAEMPQDTNDPAVMRRYLQRQEELRNAEMRRIEQANKNLSDRARINDKAIKKRDKQLFRHKKKEE